MGWGDALFHEAPLDVVHFCTALSAKKAYCSARAWPEVSRTSNSSRSFRTPSAKGCSVAALTAWKHSSGARHPRACFFTFTRASLRNASMLGSFGTGFRLSLRGPNGWPGGRKKNGVTEQSINVWKITDFHPFLHRLGMQSASFPPKLTALGLAWHSDLGLELKCLTLLFSFLFALTITIFQVPSQTSKKQDFNFKEVILSFLFSATQSALTSPVLLFHSPSCHVHMALSISFRTKVFLQYYLVLGAQSTLLARCTPTRVLIQAFIRLRNIP